MLKSDLEKNLQAVLKDLNFEVSDIVLYIPKKSEFGDYTTNISLQLANQLSSNGKQDPIDIANKIVNKLQVTNYSKEYLEKIEVLPPGYINFYFKDEKLLDEVRKACDYASFVNPGSFRATPTSPLNILLEYAQPNTHKAFHIGHTRNITLGESLARLLESRGHTIYRCTYGSDIGLPVAKAIWGVMQLKDEYKKAKKLDVMNQAKFLGKAYAKGAKAYEEQEDSKIEIDDLNRSIYLKEYQIMQIWKETRQWSLDYLNQIYHQLGTKFDNVYTESQVSDQGKSIVESNIGDLFKQDQGSVIFPGVEYGLHNRVFISSQGNPTYEAKELGLAKREFGDFNYDRSYHLVASEQSGYFQVVFKVIDLLFPELAGKKVHISYEYVDLKGRKMSSRLGDVVTFDELLAEVRKKVSKLMKIDSEDRDKTIDIISIGAIKFMMLQYSPQTKIYFDLEKSVSLEGDSGPYIQYTYARAKSVLRSAEYNYKPEFENSNLNKFERDILQKLEHFPAVVEEASESLNPTILANFLLELSRLFNLFYQQNQIIKSEDKSGLRLAITCALAVTIAQGLYLLGIDVVERM